MRSKRTFRFGASYMYPVSGSLKISLTGALNGLNLNNIAVTLKYTDMQETTLDLLRAEGWEIRRNSVVAYGKEFPLVHPFPIYSKLYREETNPDLKYLFLTKMHHMLWPKDVLTWNYWTERRFKAYCEGWRITSWASGKSTGKSVDAAKLAVLDWIADPRGTGVIVASTTLESIKARVYGYVLSYVKSMALDIPFQLMRSNPPKILFDRDDELHSISTIAAAKGRDNSAIQNYIGRHPKRKLVLILDEGPDLDPIILESLPNLEKEGGNFQVLVLGNSNSKMDLHGILSTPKDGWGSVNPTVSTQWETTQKQGLCLFFSCYESPAIFEKDPVKKKALTKFLITSEQIEEKQKEYGDMSDAFWRFVLGFWRESSTDPVVVSKEFLNSFDVVRKAEWSGMHELHIVGGLDPAFSTGGDQCVLRLAVLGQTTGGQVVLDYRGDSLLFKIPITVQSDKSAELQIADQVKAICEKYNCRLEHICIDANGQGRALGETIRLRWGALKPPIKIYSTRAGHISKNSFDVVIKNSHELWFTFREFIQNGQIKGLDPIATAQLTNRLEVTNPKTFKKELESKREYKVRMGAIIPSLARSPDEADAAALALQSAIINFGFFPGQRREIRKVEGFEHEKYLAYKEQLRAVQEQKREVDLAPPTATFSGGLEDFVKIKSITPF